MKLNKTESEITQEVIAKLAAEGVHAFVVTYESMDEEFKADFADDSVDGTVLRVPAWETKYKGLCRNAVYQFIHSKLAGQGGKGFVASVPAVGYTDVYCYYPLAVSAGKELSFVDVMVNGCGSSLEHFSWDEIVEGDDSAWWDGWDAPTGLTHLPKRLATLSILLGYQIVDLPPIKPFTEQELIAELQKPHRSEGLFCHSKDHNERWSLRLSAAGTLELHKAGDGSKTPITAECCDGMGGLVLDGHMLMHRCWGF